MVHAVEFALNPDMIGTKQKRKARIDGVDKLTLSAREDLGRETTRQHTLVWTRLE